MNVFHNDVPALFKYADDSTTIAPVTSNSDPSTRLVKLFLNWSKENNMICNPSRCEKFVVRKKNNNMQYGQIYNIPQCTSLLLLGVTLQSDCKFSELVRLNLVKVNRCLHVLRSLRKDQYSQVEIDHLFRSLVLPNFTMAFLCMELLNLTLNYTTFFRSLPQVPLCFFSCFYQGTLYRQDCKILKAITSIDNHPLLRIYHQQRRINIICVKTVCQPQG